MPARINPWKQFIGAMIPNWLMERTEISSGGKLCYARLAQHAGRDADCRPQLETLAQELGCTARSVKRYTSELVSADLIEVERRGHGRPNRYHFLDHVWMSPQIECEGTDSSLVKRTDVSLHERTDPSPPIGRDSSEENPEENPLERDTHVPKPVRRALTPEFMDQMRDRYRAKFGSDDAVDEVIQTAVNHIAYGKRTDKQQYVNNWLRNEGTKGESHAPTQRSPAGNKYRDALFGSSGR